jgi:hypothetical protein
MVHWQMPVTTPSIAKSGMSVSRLKKCESLEAALSRVVEEEARGIGKVLAMVEKVTGIGGSPQEVGTLATVIGTMEEALGLVEEAVGDPIGTKARQWVMFVQCPSHLVLLL